MDQELRAYLEQRFDGIDQRFERVEGQVDGLRQEFTQRFEQIDHRFERVEESIRHTGIEVEGLRDEIRLVAEAVDANDKKTERRFDALSTELKQEIGEVRSLLKVSYSELDRRVQVLEAKAS